MLNVIKLSVILLNVIMLNVVAPKCMVAVSQKMSIVAFLAAKLDKITKLLITQEQQELEKK